jgi:beta-ribofuranosylaminobenzene 5'-phosphate synthase
MRVQVRSPSRLHFSLIDLNGGLGRVDGSIGLALNHPSVILEVSSNDTLEITGVQTDFVHALATRFAQHYSIDLGAKIHLASAIPSHVGLGSTTQLALSIAAALSRLFGLETTARDLAQVMGRGGTSGIGVVAFEMGGLIVDGGHSFGADGQKQSFLPSRAANAPPGPVLIRYAFPGDWMFVLAIPNVPPGLEGKREVSVFQERCPIPPEEVGAVCRLILMKLLPAVVERSIEEFGAGLSELQNVGFSRITRDLMHPAVVRCIEFMNNHGAYGSGQSSFGPTVFSLVRGEGEAERLREEVANFLSSGKGGEVFVASANNVGADVQVEK